MVLPSGGPVCANVLDIIVLCIMCVAQLSISGMLLWQCGLCHERVERRLSVEYWDKQMSILQHKNT